jgi:hypothetical protein
MGKIFIGLESAINQISNEYGVVLDCDENATINIIKAWKVLCAERQNNRLTKKL